MSSVTNNQAVKTPSSSSIKRRDTPVSEELKNSNLHPLLKKIYANRGVTKLKQVDYSLKKLIDFSAKRY